ncbi:small RNA 2'-O-methyltransferase-like isoform X2 [Zingiber officinale]|nr:small RNA 2'-O-methyltransferase-like isoform X2 [Zingiber officinale]
MRKRWGDPFNTASITNKSISGKHFPCFEIFEIGANPSVSVEEFPQPSETVIMEYPEQPGLSIKRPVITPKAVIHQKFGSSANYRIEEVKEDVENGCPGLTIPQQAKILYRCHLDLPGLSVTSEPFSRKKDAEQSAARIAVEKLHIQPSTSDSTPEEASKELVERISGFFTDGFLSSSHPLIGHFGVALKANREHFGMIPISAIASCDVKVNNLCKIIICKAESDPLLVSSLIFNAARKSSELCTADDGLWIWKKVPYSPETIASVNSCDSDSLGFTKIQSLHIPCSIEENVEPLTLDVSDDNYYLDLIAQKLNVRDSSQILVSRTVGKASSELKLYFPLPHVPYCEASSYLYRRTRGNVELMLNQRASYLSGQYIYGNAILANIGYSWKTTSLYHENVSICSYYRMLLAKVPDGYYKLSREAILVSELPTEYTGRSNWRGPTPKDLLSAFCHQHRLLEPVFSVTSNDTESSVSHTLVTSSPLSSTEVIDKIGGDRLDVGHRNLDNSDIFRCKVKILSRKMQLILEGSFADTNRKESDVIHSSALRVLLWFDKYFKQLDIPVETLSSFGSAHGITVSVENVRKEFSLYLSTLGLKQNYCLENSSLESFCKNHPDRKLENGMVMLSIDGLESGIFPLHGSLICIGCAVALVKIGDPEKYYLESKDEFEFEVGTGAVIYQIEACVTQLSVNQTAQFVTDIPSRDVILVAAGETAKHLLEMPLHNCLLEYTLKVLRVAEPLEDRMEQAFFNPSLSKQRVMFAVKHINESSAATLVDFGCGSGSLLDSLLDHATSLEKIVGVDISRKGLTRAAKIIHQKLSQISGMSSIKHAVLYYGSITVPDSHVFGFDIGTCLEVIEHMDEDQASLFGNIALGTFCPRILIVSTPNYEYNPILQRSAAPTMEEKTTPCKFRNHDHRFEWTREQFEHWAIDLSARHNYHVEFSGVGGLADVEPGFASQIAVFRRNSNLCLPAEEKPKMEEDLPRPYELIWEWSNS